MEIRHGNLCCGGEVKRIPFDAIALVFELRKLGSSDQGFGLSEKRRAYLHVTVILCMKIKKKVDQGPFKSRTLAFETGKAATRDLRRAFKINQVETLNDGNMIFAPHGYRALAPRANHRILGRIATLRHTLLRQVGKDQQEVPLFLLEKRPLFGEGLHFGSFGPHPGFNGARVLAIGPHGSDLLTQAVAFGLQALKPRFERPPLCICCQHGIDGILQSRTSCRETGLHNIGLIADKADVEHEFKANQA